MIIKQLRRAIDSQALVAIYTHPEDHYTFLVAKVLYVTDHVYHVATFDSGGRFDGFVVGRVDDIISIEWETLYLHSFNKLSLSYPSEFVKDISGFQDILIKVKDDSLIIKVLRRDWTEFYLRVAEYDEDFLRGNEVSNYGPMDGELIMRTEHILRLEYGNPEMRRLG